jgi:thiamine-phosphate pyrophosphorylase
MSSKLKKAFAGTRLYPITDRHISRLSHTEQVAHLSDAGAKVIQLREKTEPTLQFYREAEAALKVARDKRVQIIINDRVDLALALKADGVHLGQDDLPPEAARRILGPDAIIGFSTHNHNQAQLAAQMPVDYIAIGPIFQTSTKESSNPALGLDGLKRARVAVGSMTLVAIGGITLENAASVLTAGADLLAVISDLWLPSMLATNRLKQFLEPDAI